MRIIKCFWNEFATTQKFLKGDHHRRQPTIKGKEIANKPYRKKYHIAKLRLHGTPKIIHVKCITINMI